MCACFHVVCVHVSMWCMHMFPCCVCAHVSMWCVCMFPCSVHVSICFFKYSVCTCIGVVSMRAWIFMAVFKLTWCVCGVCTCMFVVCSWIRLCMCESGHLDGQLWSWIRFFVSTSGQPVLRTECLGRHRNLMVVDKVYMESHKTS